jgi:hypothetical protein
LQVQQLQHVNDLQKFERTRSFGSLQESGIPAPQQSGRRNHFDSGFRSTQTSGKTGKADQYRMVFLCQAEVEVKIENVVHAKIL